jgi:hypothetical protein
MPSLTNSESSTASSVASTTAWKSGEAYSLGRSSIALGAARRAGVRRTRSLVEKASA